MIVWLGLAGLGLDQEPPTNLENLGTVNLGWDASTSPEVTRYTIYWGPSAGAYIATLELGNGTTASVVGLAPGLWYFAVKAYSNTGLESVFSNEVSTVVPGKEGFAVEGPQISDISATSIRLGWKTSVAATSRIEFTYSGGPFSSLTVEGTAVTNHYVRLTGLVGGKVYSYEVFNVDLAGNTVAVRGSFRTR